MTDKELLELAAKDAGCELDIPYPNGTFDLVTKRKDGEVVKRNWNPLSDDGGRTAVTGKTETPFKFNST